MRLIKPLFAAIMLLVSVQADAASLWPNSGVAVLDSNGTPEVGALAYFYNADTTTPRAVYSDPELTTPHTQPVEADSAGRFAAVYLPAGEYRYRVTDSAGTVLFDFDNVSVPINEETTAETDVLAEEIHQTGDVKARYASGAHDGWVRMNGRTIGNASSGASERANADTEDLFEYLWTADSNLTVSGGRGGSAASDYAANKTITLPDLRGRVMAGLDAMGSSDATRIADSYTSGTDADELGGSGGVDDVTLTTNEMPTHTHGTGTLALDDPSHEHFTVKAGSSSQSLASNAYVTYLTGTAASTYTLQGATGTVADYAPTSSGNLSGALSGSLANAGSGGAHANLSPFMLVTFYMKL